MKRSAFYSLINFINSTNVDDVYHNAAKTILLNIFKIPQYNITEVAQICYVSTATISRLCRKLSYESFLDFKHDVILNLNYFNQDSKRMIYDYQLPEENNLADGKEVFNDHFENILNNLRDTFNNVKYEELVNLVDRMHEARKICFAGNYFTQSVSMQLQIELSYLGKDCVGMYSLEQQREIIKDLSKDDIIIVSSISGGYFENNPDTIRLISRSKAYKVVITQLDEFICSDKMDKILKVGNDHHSLIGKFSITYIFEVLEALYHIKYGNKGSIN